MTISRGADWPVPSVSVGLSLPLTASPATVQSRQASPQEAEASCVGACFRSLVQDRRAGTHHHGGDCPLLAQGILEGTLSVGRGVVEGVAGVFISPVRGAMDDGVSGFFKGVGR